jgi:hypothetical protein
MYDVTQSPYNADNTGVTDARSAIQDAIDDAEAAGGGTVFFPQGTYLLDSSTLTPGAHSWDVALIINDDNVTLEGEGTGRSIIIMGDELDAQMIGFAGCQNVAIKKLEVDGNSANQTDTRACIYTDGDVDRFLIQDVYVHNSSGYGIGLQYGKLTNVDLQNVLIEDTGSDGFDNKNEGEDCTSNRMTNVTVRRAGLNTNLTTQACIDLRGVWNLTNIICEDFNNTSARCNAGIRFRTGAVETPDTGAHRSTLTNFFIKASTSTSVNGITQSAYQVAINAGQITDCENGILFNGLESTVGDVIAKTCQVGFKLDTGSDRTTLTACMARSCGDYGFYIASDQAIILGLEARSCQYGINLRNTAQYAVLSGVSSNSSTNNFYIQSGGATWKDAGLYY